MSTIFRLDASIRREGSVTRGVADTLESAIVDELDTATTIRRDVAFAPVDPSVWATAAFAGYTPEDQRTPEQIAALGTAAQLADELESADVLIFAVPMYNFGVSHHFKTWVDTVAADPRFGPGSETIKGRPAFLVTARGGGYGEGTPRAGWDHATGWMRRYLEDVWGLDLDVIETELTLADVTPQMAELRDLAHAQLAESHETARTTGRSVTVKLHALA
ncbi:FMN-dependent NADH-azoreductase [Aeromicrobium sp. UC242_57]|uniref:FMN-dependent NADH-azoreductase n=1 Tax=Aeromicrobium sp. UC242_57 TaxID=3374624 RepID=UPI0037ADEFC1